MVSFIYSISYKYIFSGMPPRDFHAFAAAFQSINRLIEAFQSHLIPLSQVEASDPILRTVILTHALTDAAIIKLHANFAYGDASSKQKCLAAARNMVNFGGTNLADLRHINPIMGVSAFCIASFL